MVRIFIVLLAFLLSGCAQSKEAETTSQLQVKLEAIIACDWTEPKAGMVGELEVYIVALRYAPNKSINL